MTKEINIPLGKKKEKKFITVNVGSNSFDVAVDEISMEKLLNQCVNLSVKFTSGELETMEDAKEIVKESYNIILGKGSFKKVYKESGSVIECMDILMKVAEGISYHFKPSQQEKATKLAKKKANK